MRLASVAALFCVFTATNWAAPQPPADRPQPPRGQMPTLGRPTQPTDETPLFNFGEYFNGRWSFTWDVPDGVLGPAGTITGTTVYKSIDGKFWEAATDASGPLGPITITELIAYQKENRTLARYVTDSRGLSFLQAATIGGDLGGYFNIYYESAPFAFMGKTLRIKQAMRLLSPVNYRVGTTVSVDGGPFVNYGNPWWRRDPGAALEEEEEHETYLSLRPRHRPDANRCAGTTRHLWEPSRGAERPDVYKRRCANPLSALRQLSSPGRGCADGAADLRGRAPMGEGH
jgi:hypothetical protein